jgi:hypothetical protein
MSTDVTTTSGAAIVPRMGQRGFGRGRRVGLSDFLLKDTEDTIEASLNLENLKAHSL